MVESLEVDRIVDLLVRSPESRLDNIEGVAEVDVLTCYPACCSESRLDNEPAD